MTADGEDIDGGQKKDGIWLPCPLCGSRTKTKIYEDTVLINFPLYCPKCKKETRINVVLKKMVLSKEPDA